MSRPSLAREPGPPSHRLSLVLRPGPQELEHWLQGLQELQAAQGWPQLSSWLGSPSQVPPLVRGLQSLLLLLLPSPQLTLQELQGLQTAQP